MRIFSSIILFVTAISITGCLTSNPKSDVENPPKNEPLVRWDRDTLKKVYTGSAFYPRIKRLSDQTMIGVFESGGGVWTTKSIDEGKTWDDATQVAFSRNGINAAVPELIQLQNGALILAYNTRPPSDNQDEKRRFGIKIKISEDNGETWSEEYNIYEGGYEWNRGVWEPAMIQLSDGEVQLYFANEHPYINNKDQEISMVRSQDNGLTWSQPQAISYRKGFRDGMPVPLILKENAGIAVAIEDNGLYGSTFKPTIIWSAMDEQWPQIIAGQDSNRWGALDGEEKINPSSYGGAPYLDQMPDGRTVLSFQTNEGRTGDWTNSRMAVAIGNNKASNFSDLTYPFDVPEGRSAMWGSLFIKNDSTITAVTSTNAYSTNGQSEFYTIDGYLTPAAN